MKGLVGRKIGMTQGFDEGIVVPVTVIEVGPCYVTQKKTKDVVPTCNNTLVPW